MSELNEIIAKNIAALRKKSGMTQLNLAEKLNYSDKAVSKWERGESVPDISVLKQIADMFGVSVDWLITRHTNEKIRLPDIQDRRKGVVMLSVLGVWLVAITVFATGFAVQQKIGYFWLSFVAAVPVSFIVLVVFNSIWGKLRTNEIYISGLVWTLIAFIYLLLLVHGHNFWLLFLIGLPLEAGVIIWHRIMLKNDR